MRAYRATIRALMQNLPVTLFFGIDARPHIHDDSVVCKGGYFAAVKYDYREQYPVSTTKQFKTYAEAGVRAR
jgi:hypothetical protein